MSQVNPEVNEQSPHLPYDLADIKRPYVDVSATFGKTAALEQTEADSERMQSMR